MFLTPEEFISTRPLNESPQERFVAAARSCLDVRYLHQGRDPQTGLDCLGVIEFAGYLCGWVQKSEFTFDYLPTPDGVRLEKGIASRLDEVPIEEARHGDVYLIRYARDPQHVAVRVDDSTRFEGTGLLHGFQGKSGLQSRVLEEPWARWQSRLLKAYRLPASCTVTSGGLG